MAEPAPTTEERLLALELKVSALQRQVAALWERFGKMPACDPTVSTPEEEAFWDRVEADLDRKGQHS